MDTSTPQSRNEAILHYALGEEIEPFIPQSRMEVLLLEVAEEIRQGGGGGGSMEALKIRTMDGLTEYDGSTETDITLDKYFITTFGPVPGSESWSDYGDALPDVFSDTNFLSRTYYYPALIVDGSDLFTLGDTDYMLNYSFTIDGNTTSGTVGLNVTGEDPNFTNGKKYHSDFGLTTLKPTGVNDDEYVIYTTTIAYDTQEEAEAAIVAFDFSTSSPLTPGVFTPRNDMQLALPAFTLMLGSDVYTYDGSSAVSVTIIDGDQGSY